MSRKLKNKRKKQVHLITHHHPKVANFSEQYRFSELIYYFSSVDREIKSIVVTSPEPSDGKSTTAESSYRLGTTGKTVLLVGC